MATTTKRPPSAPDVVAEAQALLAALDEPVKEQRGYASINVNITGAMISVPVSVVPIKRPGLDEEKATVLVCDDGHEHPVRPSQKYLCPEAPAPTYEVDAKGKLVLAEDGMPIVIDAQHGPFAESELSRAREKEDGTLVVLSPEKLEYAKFGDIEPNEFDITPYPEADVIASCRPGKLGYRLRPPKKASAKVRDLYGALMAAIDVPGYIWVGKVRIKNSMGMYRLEVWRGQLCMTELTHPADLAATDDLSGITVTDGIRDMAGQLAEALAGDWDPEEYRNDVKAQLDRLAIEVSAAGGAPEPEAPAATGTVLDLTAALQAAVKAKAPAKKPAARKSA